MVVSIDAAPFLGEAMAAFCSPRTGFIRRNVFVVIRIGFDEKNLVCNFRFSALSQYIPYRATVHSKVGKCKQKHRRAIKCYEDYLATAWNFFMGCTKDFS